jgi:hypothetical protein
VGLRPCQQAHLRDPDRGESPYLAARGSLLMSGRATGGVICAMRLSTTVCMSGRGMMMESAGVRCTATPVRGRAPGLPGPTGWRQHRGPRAGARRETPEREGDGPLRHPGGGVPHHRRQSPEAFILVAMPDGAVGEAEPVRTVASTGAAASHVRQGTSLSVKVLIVVRRDTRVSSTRWPSGCCGARWSGVDPPPHAIHGR